MQMPKDVLEQVLRPAANIGRCLDTNAALGIRSSVKAVSPINGHRPAHLVQCLAYARARHVDQAQAVCQRIPDANRLATGRYSSECEPCRGLSPGTTRLCVLPAVGTTVLTTPRKTAIDT